MIDIIFFQRDFHYITLEEFFNNGFILLFVIFVAKLIERVCVLTSQYMLIVESVHIRTAVQVSLHSIPMQWNIKK